MTAGWLLLLGGLHGLQPEHALSASAMAARAGASAWRTGLRLAAGHAAALGLAAATIQWIPSNIFASMETWAARAGGASLVLFGLLLVVQVIRGRYLLHAHDHEHGPRRHAHLHAHPAERTAAHEHGHGTGAVALGLALGLGGARSFAVLLPALEGPLAGAASIAAYAAGVALGCVAACLGVDLVRGRAGGGVRWLDLATGVASCAAGARVIMGA